MRILVWIFSLLTLTAVWAGITADISVFNLLVGVAVSGIGLWFIRDFVVPTEVRVRPFRVAWLAMIFFYELGMSAWSVVRLVIRPRLEMRPAIVALPLSTGRDFEITMLANMITLTPGTLSVDVSEDKSTLYVHALDVDDPDELRRYIKRTFESRIMRAFR